MYCTCSQPSACWLLCAALPCLQVTDVVGQECLVLMDRFKGGIPGAACQPGGWRLFGAGGASWRRRPGIGC